MKSPPLEHHLQDCQSPCWAMPHTSITELCFELLVKCHLTPIGSGVKTVSRAWCTLPGDAPATTPLLCLTMGLAEILLSASFTVFFCPGDIPSPVTALRCGGPIQHGSPGTTEDHQPARAAAGAAGLPLPPGRPGPPTLASLATPALCHLRLHCEGQLLLQWPR